MAAEPGRRLTDYASCAGCAGKLAPQGIAKLLAFLPAVRDVNLLVGTETHDDAGVYRLNDDMALVQTVDFFPPLIDDPFIYGQIAAANALSDVYAMGGEPKTVLNIVGYPDDELGNLDWLGLILQGGAERCGEAGAVVVGGHSVRDREIKFGMAVTGVVHPQRIWTNAGARPGDRLILTKPLGTGFVTGAAKKDCCPPDVLAAACASMVQLNRVGKEAVAAVGGAHAVTDITGFGLAGHALEMAVASQATLAIDVGRLPILPGVLENQLTRVRSRASRSNRDYVNGQSQCAPNINPTLLEFLWDPQTSGGLLVSIAADSVKRLVHELNARGAQAAAVIGQVSEFRGVPLLFSEMN